MKADTQRFETAIHRFDETNSDDPTMEVIDGRSYPKEVLYAQRMSACLDQVAPTASEPLRLAVRCQHIRRWAIPRQDFPMTRAGYHQWRNTLKKYHAEVAGRLLQEVGYEPETILRVQALLQKQQLQHDPEVQLLEDVICLVFLEYYFQDFAAQHPEEKVIDIVQKTWRKMTPQGHELALQLPLAPTAQALVAKALASAE
ncbi:DUF4202 domain-containing protein [Hymenobacter wooponensis]|uniref:DUF4202 domain-containing protein n=1 Tax=Hymenobacter wooponensis TaxID=1525360 RepID=A0A4Z0MS38_9BACT|nr:DUF4202 domain-containing protein [Hymenobacter wooponensis]TGD82623.1 DUF4202 domain-containing protein [Hymenobacter wooponensis]